MKLRQYYWTMNSFKKKRLKYKLVDRIENYNFSISLSSSNYTLVSRNHFAAVIAVWTVQLYTIFEQKTEHSLRRVGNDTVIS
jgi:hypothetical protein